MTESYIPFHDFRKRILETYLQEKKEPRYYIGASSIGHACDRKIWLQWRGDIQPKDYMESEKWLKQQRAFERGIEEEERHILRLEKAGYIISDRQKQFLAAAPIISSNSFATSSYPYFFGLKGHIDGIIIDSQDPKKTKYILEIKSAKENYFKGVINPEKGLEEIYPQYIKQVQLYMHFAEIHQTFVLLINKNDDELHHIILKYNPAEAEGMIEKSNRIASIESLPIGIKNEIKPPYQCKMCEFKGYCYEKET
jgi:hypothetical protein